MGELAELALDIMAIPDTSAAAERVFSQCGIATTNRRMRLSEKRLKDEAMIRLNADFLYK